ncbi:MAG: NUDIX hydrolase [Ilumatobacteraceae bacterium]
MRPDPDRGTAVDPLRLALDSHRPATPTEAADLARVRRRLADGDPWDRSTSLHVTASALIVHPPSRRVLLRWHARQQAWLQVGGHGDPGEHDPLHVTLREGREETGLDDLVAWPHGRIVHVVIVPVPASDREPAHEHADIRFVLATHAPDRARPENPTAALRWLTFDEARTTTTEPNLHETLDRIEHLLLEVPPDADDPGAG